MTTAQIAILDRIYQERPCWICGKRKWCGHREPRVDLAELEALTEKDPKV